MQKVRTGILDINNVICSNIDRFDINDRGLLSQNILSQLRNFIEHISLMIYSSGSDIEINYVNIEKANSYVKSRGDLRFLSKFHKLLQTSASHYTFDEENSERLMLKYYEYLIRIKKYIEINYNFEILANLDSFPLNNDTILKEYHEKIAAKIKMPVSGRMKSAYKDRYYIQKIKPFFVNTEIFYEVTFCTANDKTSKFDRIIAFTSLEISHNYAVKLSISNDNIEILNKSMPIQIIDDWDVSIRPCELNNFGKIFNKHFKLGGTIEYYELMKFLTATGFSLTDLLDFSESEYDNIKRQITERAKVSHFMQLLDICRTMSNNGMSGSNVLRYLLYKMNNVIIKRQYKYPLCKNLSNLCLDYGCIPFDEMPFNSSLKVHNPKVVDLIDCINTNNREHEFLARFIKNNTELKGQLYTSRDNLLRFENVDRLIEVYNRTLYYTHTHRRLEQYKDQVYIKGYEDETFQILLQLKDLSSSGIENYSNSANAWLKSSAYSIDCSEKKAAFIQMFQNSRVASIYGSAGTGKSTMINHISNFFNLKKKIYWLIPIQLLII